MRKPVRKQTIYLTADPSMIAWLRRRAQDQHTSVSAIMRQLVAAAMVRR